MTAIARTWKDGDTAACRLCPECTARNGLCLVLVETASPIPQREIPLYRIPVSTAPAADALTIISVVATATGAAGIAGPLPLLDSQSGLRVN